jgi:hypothetical protein
MRWFCAEAEEVSMMREGYTSSFVSVMQPDEPDSRAHEGDAAPLSDSDVRTVPPDKPRMPPALALDPDILGSFRSDLRRAGVAGEEKLASLVYLAVTSRLLPWGKPTERPVSVIPKGTTSTGKSHATRTTLRFFPESAYIDLGSMSRRYLFYSEESFEHRFVYVPEWASIKEDEELVALFRILLSEGHIAHGTVDTDRSARLIEKSGPTGLLMTTTEAAVDMELETRCLTIVTDDSTEQTRRVYRVLAELESELETPVDFDAWRELQEWIGETSTRAVVPFVDALSELMPDSATRLRRDFASLLSLVRTHALLYQAQRQTDAQGRVVASIEGDYGPVRELVSDLIAEGVEASVSQTIRETVDAVSDIQVDGVEHVSPKALAERLGVGRSATYDRIRRALMAGYLVNVAGKDERGMKLAIGSSLPRSDEFLPSPEQVVRLTSGKASGRPPSPTTYDRAELSGRPVCPDAEINSDEIERLADLARQLQLGEHEP